MSTLLNKYHEFYQVKLLTRGEGGQKSQKISQRSLWRPLTKRIDRHGKNWENYSLTSMFIEKSVKSSLIYSEAKLCDFISVFTLFKKWMWF